MLIKEVTIKIIIPDPSKPKQDRNLGIYTVFIEMVGTCEYLPPK